MLRKIMVYLIIVFFFVVTFSFISFNNYMWIDKTIFNILIIMGFMIILSLSKSVYLIIKNGLYNNNYLFHLTATTLITPLFSLFFFNLNNLILSFLSLVIILIIGIFFIIETRKLDKFASFYIIPYLVFNFYLLVTVSIILNFS